MSKKILEGIVVRAKEKTVRVEIESSVKHPIYSKVIKRKKIILSHDEENIAKPGDRVEIESCRPISLKKSFIVKKVIK